VAQVKFDLTGEVAVLTGGAGILGAAFAAALSRNGARVAVVDRDGAKAEQVAAKCHGVRAYEADITDPGALRLLEQRIEAEFAPPTVLINNAAAKSANFFAQFEDFPLRDWDEVMNINLTGAMLCAQVFGRSMAARRRGSIINTLSIYGVVAPDQRIYEGSSYEGRAINTPAVYSTSKAALWGLTKYLATYWAERGVRVNALTPGGVFSGQNGAFVQRYGARVPMGRMAEREEMCGALLFLASPAASYVTGQNIIVDGGLTAW
jgi:NAD(P)-dependent dehydrogenase (short-subunit alcohol dehydrogenase family)